MYRNIACKEVNSMFLWRTNVPPPFFLFLYILVPSFGKQYLSLSRVIVSQLSASKDLCISCKPDISSFSLWWRCPCDEVRIQHVVSHILYSSFSLFIIFCHQLMFPCMLNLQVFWNYSLWWGSFSTMARFWMEDTECKINLFYFLLFALYFPFWKLRFYSWFRSTG